MEKKSNLMTFWECYSTSIGYVIGAGIITMTGVAIGYTGSGVFIAYILAGIALLVVEGPRMLGSSVVPKTSASYLFAHTLGTKFAGMFSFISLFGSMAIGFYGISFVNYFNSVLNIGIDSRIIGVTVLAIFFIINIFGAKNVALVQTLLNVILISAWASFIFLGLGKVNTAQFTIPQMFPNGFSGILNSVAMLIFAMGGGTWLVNSGEKIENPEKNIIKVNVLTTGTAMILFALISIVAAGVLPISEVANQPLTLVARAVYPGNTFMFFVIGGALVALITTMSANILDASLAMYKSTKEGWFPKVFDRENRYGVPHALLLLVFILSALPIALGIDTTLLARMTSGCSLMIKLIPNIALYKALTVDYKEEWEKSSWHMSNGSLLLFQIVCNSLLLILIINNFRAYPLPIFLTFFGLMVLFFFMAVVREKNYLEVMGIESKNKKL